MIKIIVMLILSIILNIFSLCGQLIDYGKIGAYQWTGLILQIVCVILLF